MARRWPVKLIVLLTICGVLVTGCSQAPQATVDSTQEALAPAATASSVGSVITATSVEQATASVGTQTVEPTGTVAAPPTPTRDLPTPPPKITAAPAATAFPLNAGWWDSSVCYEIFVRSFYDSNGDGVGDLNGLIQKLDYINDGNPDAQQDLGATCIWLMPIAESPSYHGYDVADYYTVDREYGTNDDFKRLVEEAHKRGIKIVLDLVLNHTSSQNPWFQDALNNPQSPYRDWYLWSNDNPGYRGPWGQQVWHKSPVRDEYFYGIFYDGMPDLNYRNPEVTAEAEQITAFWLNEMGADGFRLDAIKHLIENGVAQEHTVETHNWLKQYRAFLQRTKPDAFTIGEIFDADPGLLTSYYPDQLDMYFEFSVGEKLIGAANGGSATPFVQALQATYNGIPYQRWASFLTNHDQNRVMGSFNGDYAKAKVAATALLTLPGLPFVYYGEEIGMIGVKPDERIRTPMQWNAEANGGFTSGQPWQPFQPNLNEVNIAAQDTDPASLLNLYRRLIHLHTSQPALATGELIVLQTNNPAVAAYVRRSGDQAVLVLLNFGTAAAENVVLQAEPAQFTPAGYTIEPLLDVGATQEFAILSTTDDPTTAATGPLQPLAPKTGYVFKFVQP